MQKNLLRYGLGALVATGVALSGLLIACGDDDNGEAPKPDAAVGDTGTGTGDSGGGDSGGGDAGQKPKPAKIQIVNASTDLGPDAAANGALRICFASSGTVVTAPPLPNEASTVNGTLLPPGVPIGLGGVVPSFGLPLDTISITPYVMNAKTLAQKGNFKGTGGTQVSCEKLVGSGATAGAATENVDFWKLPDIPANTLLSGKSYALVLTGCPANTTLPDASAKCGSGFTGTPGTPGVGNLKVNVFELDNATTVPGTSIGLQFVHAATPAQATLTALNVPVQPGVGPAEADGGGYQFIGGGQPVTLGQKTALSNINNWSLTTSEMAPSPGIYTAQGAALRSTGIKFSNILALSYPNPSNPAQPNVPAGGDYKNGAAFVVFAVGDFPQSGANPAGPDPDAGNGSFNTRVFHYLAFPTNPTVPDFAP